MSKVKFSIVIPVYNAENYLQECLNSIISQSYNNYEVILINDGSTDHSLEIIKKNLHNPRVRLIDSTNFGVSYARNIGLTSASGDYIFMIDSDDLLKQNSLKKIAEVIDKTNEKTEEKINEKTNNIEAVENQEKEPEVNQEENKITEIEQQEEQKDENNEDKTENIEKQENTQKQETLEKINEQIEKMESKNYDETPKEDFSTMYEKLFGRKPLETPILQEEQQEDTTNTAIDLVKNNMSVFDQSAEYQKPIYKFIGIVFNTYIIIEMDKEMYIIDQHAAHERIMYEKVKKNYYSETSKDSQMLLLPDIITLTHKEMDIAKDNIDMFEKAGFSLEEFGENTIKLTGVPTVCLDIDNKDLFLETLDEINTVARTAKQEKEEKFIATVACKAAVKANMVLDRAEVENLMDKLLELPNPFTCPHGRPTAIKMSKYDIERKFARK